MVIYIYNYYSNYPACLDPLLFCLPSLFFFPLGSLPSPAFIFPTAPANVCIPLLPARPARERWAFPSKHPPAWAMWEGNSMISGFFYESISASCLHNLEAF